MADTSGIRDAIAGIKDRVARLGAAIDVLQGKAGSVQSDIDEMRDRANEINDTLDALIADAEGSDGDIPGDVTPEEPPAPA